MSVKKTARNSQSRGVPGQPENRPGGPVETLARLLIVAAYGALAYLLWGMLAGILFPVLAALLLAYLLSPLITWMGKKGISRGLAIALVFVGFLLLFFSTVVVLYPVIAREVVTVVEKFPGLIDLIENKTIPWLRDTAGVDVPTTVSGAMENYGESLKQAFPGMLNKAGTWFVAAATSTGTILSGILNVVLIPVFTFYFLADFQIIVSFFENLIPDHRRERTVAALSRVDAAVGNWLRGQIEVAIVLSLLYGTGLAIVFGIFGLGAKTGFAIGALTGVLNIIPYVGVGTGLVLSLAITLLEWQGIGAVISTASVFVGVQIMDGYFITPRIVGEKVGLGPAAVIISLLVGGGLFGLAGMLLAIPVAAALRTLWPDILEKYKSSRFYTGSP